MDTHPGYYRAHDTLYIPCTYPPNVVARHVPAKCSSQAHTRKIMEGEDHGRMAGGNVPGLEQYILETSCMFLASGTSVFLQLEICSGVNKR
jgi:hypothetical protein